MRRVSIIIPIFKNHHLLEKLWDSLWKHTHWNMVQEIILVNDSPHALEIHELCTQYQRFSETPVTYIKNEYNLGFVHSCNTALQKKHSDTHALLLNTDVLVFENWLQKLQHCYQSISDQGFKVGSITPLTNNGTLATVPQLNQPYSQLQGVFTPERMNQLAAHFYDQHTYLFEVPVGVGFCFWMSHEALEAIGSFDEAFAPGYGEEVDWCLRAHEKGFCSILDPATFVWHEGGGSFQKKKKALQHEHEKLIQERYPYYPELLQNYFQSDSPIELRRLFTHYWNVLKELQSESIELHWTTLNPFEAFGGIEHWIYAHLQKSSSHEQWILCRVSKDDQSDYGLFNAKGVLLVRGTQAQLQSFLHCMHSVLDLPIQQVLIHHWKRWEPQDVLELLAFFKQEQIELIYHVHDYFLITPECHLYSKKHSPTEVLQLPEQQPHRDFTRRALRYVDEIRYPSETAQHWVQQCSDFQDLHAPQVVIPHQTWDNSFSATSTHWEPHTTLRFAFLGYGNEAKGAFLFLEWAKAFKNKHRFIFIGHFDKLRRYPFIRQVPFRFQETSSVSLLKQEKVDVVFLPSLTPETFGFAAYEALSANVPIITLKSSGHIATMVEQSGAGEVFDSADDIKAWLQRPSDLQANDVQQWHLCNEAASSSLSE